ncbi:MAG: hypothetical protein ISS27_01420 [Candidatus Omnitrophica bacterium]|nr:hypothetical protein [Candidatus Omnitrophota bacterium]
MGKLEYMLKDAFSLLWKLGLIILVVWVIVWFMQKGTVLVDQGKEHGFIHR